MSKKKKEVSANEAVNIVNDNKMESTEVSANEAVNIVNDNKMESTESTTKKGKGVKSFEYTKNQEKIVTAFNWVKNTIGKDLAYRGKEEDKGNKTLTVKVKKKDGTKEEKKVTGSEADLLATQRHYSVFGSRVSKNSNPEKEQEAISIIKTFIADNQTVESQKGNGQEFLDKLMSVFSKGKGGTRSSAPRTALTMDVLNFD